jgi:uncharacterized membrane protein YvbJ
MYCSSCGVVVAEGLSYCNQCGAKLSGAKSVGIAKVAKVQPESLVWAVVAIFVVGLGSIMGLMGILKVQFNAGLGIVTIFSLIILLLMLVVEGVFISLLFGSKSESNDGKSAMELLRKQTTRELEAAQPHALSEPVASVTEHTTRAFEPIYVQKKAE